MAPPRKFMSIPPMAGRNSLSVLVQRISNITMIVARQTAEFHLYAGTEHTKMLAKTQVTCQKSRLFWLSRPSALSDAFAVPTSNRRNRIEPEFIAAFSGFLQPTNPPDKFRHSR